MNYWEKRSLCTSNTLWHSRQFLTNIKKNSRVKRGSNKDQNYVGIEKLNERVMIIKLDHIMQTKLKTVVIPLK